MHSRHNLQAFPIAGEKLHKGGSVPGVIKHVPGGVSGNIARVLAMISSHIRGGTTPFIISAVGDDPPGAGVLGALKSSGVCTDGVITVFKGITPSVSIIFSSDGDVAASVADTGMLEVALTPSVLHRYGRALGNAKIVVVDADLSKQTIEVCLNSYRIYHYSFRCVGVDNISFSLVSLQEACRLASSSGATLWFEPVSTSKASRAVDVLPLLDFVSPNIAELIAMATAVVEHSPGRNSNIKVGSNKELDFSQRSDIQLIDSILHREQPHLQIILEKGVKYIVLTMGGNGAALCSFSADRLHIAVDHFPALPATVRNCSGAGDCLVAGMVHSLLRGSSPRVAMAYGMAVASKAVESKANVPPSLSAFDMERLAEISIKQSSRYTLHCQ